MTEKKQKTHKIANVKDCKHALGSDLYQSLRKEKKLPLKYIMFAAAYVNNGNNATQAYIDTIARKGTNRNAAGQEGFQILKNPKIKEAIQAVFDDWLGGQKIKFEKEIIQRQYAKAFYNVKTFFNDDGSCKKLSEIPDEWIGAIEGHEVKYYGKDGDRKVIVYRLADQQRALQELSKYITLYKEVSVQEHKITDETKKKLDEVFKNGKKPGSAEILPMRGKAK